MSNLNTILNKLGKIEEIHETNLAKHEIELALVDTLNKALAEGQKNESSYYSDFKLEINKLIDTARKIEIKYNVLASNINEPIFQMEKQAKELGLDIKSTEYYKKSQSILKSIEIRKEVIDKIINNINKFGF